MATVLARLALVTIVMGLVIGFAFRAAERVSVSLAHTAGVIDQVTHGP